MTTQEQQIPHLADRLYEDDKNKLAVTVSVIPEAAYAFFRDFENLPLFMKHLKSVTVISPKKSHWVAQVKSLSAEWDVEITDDRPGEMISWKSTPESEVQMAGTIWFSPAPETLGTVISLTLDYSMPGGKLTDLMMMASEESSKTLAFTNLRRLKCFLETQEVATVYGQPSGRDDDAEMIYKH